MKLPIFWLMFGNLLMGSSLALAQTDTTKTIDKIIDPVEVMPHLLTGGGSADIVAAVQQRLIYPREAIRAHAEGRVFVSFTVDIDGLVKNVHVPKGFRPDCDSAALEAVQKLPRFKPGQQFGKAVVCGFTVPVKFSRYRVRKSAK